VLLLIKRKTNASFNGVTVNAEMDSASVDAIKNMFQNEVPKLIQRLSGNKVTWKTFVIDDTRNPLKSVRAQGKGCWPDPRDVLSEFAHEIVPHDSVFVYWLHSDPKNPSAPALQTSENWGMWGGDFTRGKGYSTISYKPASSWTPSSEDTETFVHEWLHQLENYYDGAVYLPKPAPGDPSFLHSAGGHSYTRQNSATGPLNYWKCWYQDLLTANVSEPGARSGLGDAAWKLGTIREGRLIHRDPQNNMMEGGLSPWRFVTWSGGSKYFQAIDKTRDGISAGVMIEGKSSGVIIADKNDDARIAQTVSLKPRTNYIFSAWVKTEGVSTEQPASRFGANLSLWSQPEASRSVTGTTDWTYVSLPFNSGSRSSVELCLRLGHHGSLAKGKAFFDRVKLLEVR
jgi:hypothetical protein